MPGHTARLSIAHSTRGDGALLVAVGEIDASTIDLLRARLQRAIDDRATWVTLDCSGVTSATAAAVRVLNDAGRHLHERGGGLVVVDAPDPLEGLTRILGSAAAIEFRSAG